VEEKGDPSSYPNGIKASRFISRLSMQTQATLCDFVKQTDLSSCNGGSKQALVVAIDGLWSFMTCIGPTKIAMAARVGLYEAVAEAFGGKKLPHQMVTDVMRMAAAVAVVDESAAAVGSGDMKKQQQQQQIKQTSPNVKTHQAAVQKTSQKRLGIMGESSRKKKRAGIEHEEYLARCSMKRRKDAYARLSIKIKNGDTQLEDVLCESSSSSSSELDYPYRIRKVSKRSKINVVAFEPDTSSESSHPTHDVQQLYEGATCMRILPSSMALKETHKYIPISTHSSSSSCSSSSSSSSGIIKSSMSDATPFSGNAFVSDKNNKKQQQQNSMMLDKETIMDTFNYDNKMQEDCEYVVDNDEKRSLRCEQIRQENDARLSSLEILTREEAIKAAARSNMLDALREELRLRTALAALDEPKMSP
jgi:hypothetical protein